MLRVRGSQENEKERKYGEKFAHLIEIGRNIQYDSLAYGYGCPCIELRILAAALKHRIKDTRKCSYASAETIYYIYYCNYFFNTQ